MDEIHYLLGNTCNLSCDFCFWGIHLPDAPLAFKKRIIDQIVSSGIKKVTISGGEPLCSNNFLEVLEYMNKHGLEVVLHTHGLLIDEDIALKIAPFISRISLTLDGISENTQIRMRGDRNITKNTINLIKIFNNLDVKVNVKTLVTAINRNEIVEIGRILQNLPIKYWSLLNFIPINNGKINEKKFLISLHDFSELCREIKGQFPFMDIRIRNFGDPDRKYCFIAANGDVYTYVKDFGDVLIGNINNEELNSLIKRIEN